MRQLVTLTVLSACVMTTGCDPTPSRAVGRITPPYLRGFDPLDVKALHGEQHSAMGPLRVQIEATAIEVDGSAEALHATGHVVAMFDGPARLQYGADVVTFAGENIVPWHNSAIASVPRNGERTLTVVTPALTRDGAYHLRLFAAGIGEDGLENSAGTSLYFIVENQTIRGASDYYEWETLGMGGHR